MPTHVQETAETVSEDTTLTHENHLVITDGLSANITITLPSPASVSGHDYMIKNLDADYEVIVTPASGNLDGESSKTIGYQYTCMHVCSDGTNYVII